MSYRFDSTPLIADAYMWGDRGHGVLAEDVPSTGTNGPGYLYNDLSFPADNGKEVRGEIVSWPSAGTLTVYEDSSFEFTGAPDGNYSFTYQLYVDGVLTGAVTTVDLIVGSVVGDIPVITLTGNSTISLDQGTPYSEPGYSATDTEDGTITGSVSVVGSVDHTTVDSYQITYNVVDSDSNAAVQVIRTVNVVAVAGDTEKPVITLIGNASINVDIGSSYTDAGANVSDNVDADAVLVASGSVDVNLIGAYPLAYNYIDAAGNVADTVIRTVNIVAIADTVKPVIALIGSASIDVDEGATYTDAGANVTDNVDADSVLIASGSVDVNTVGPYVLSYDYTDTAGNVADTVTRTVNVVAVVAQEFTEPKHMMIVLQSGGVGGGVSGLFYHDGSSIPNAPYKDPNSRIDYGAKWTGWLGQGEIIVVSKWYVDGVLINTNDQNVDSLIVNSSENNDEITKVWLSGSTPEQSSKLTNRITTNQGRTVDRSMIIYCQDQ